MSLRDFLTDLNNRKDNDELDRLIISLASPDLHSSNPAIYQLSRSNHPEIEQRLFSVLRALDLSVSDEYDNYVIDDKHMFSRIVWILSRRDSKSIPALITALQDDREQVQQAAIEILGKSGDADAIQPLYQALNRVESLQSFNIVSALGHLGAKAILLELTHHESPYVRGSAITALDSDPRDQPVIDALMTALNDPVSSVRERAVAALGHTGDKRMLPALFPRLTDDSPLVRHYTALALKDIGDSSATMPLLNALQTYPSLLHGAVVALGALDDPRGVDVLIEALASEGDYIRLCAVRSLGELGYLRAVDPLINLLQTEDHRSVRQAIIEALSEFDDQRIIDLLITLLNDDSSVADAAATALGKLGGSKAVEALREFVSDQKRLNSYSWLTACRALKRLHQPAPTTLFTLVSDTTFYNGHLVAAGLGAIGDQQAVQPLLTVLALPEPTTTSEAFVIPPLRQEAIRSLGMLGIDDLNILTSVLLEDWDHEVRRTAAEVLEDLGDRQAVPALIAALKDPEPVVRAEAAYALGTLGDPQAIPALQILVDEDEGFIGELEFIDEIALYAIARIRSNP